MLWWNYTSFGLMIDGVKGNSLLDLVALLRGKICKEDFALWCAVAWSIWRDRNEVTRGGLAKQPSAVVEDAAYWLCDFVRLESPSAVPSHCPAGEVIQRWSPPAVGSLKLNVDAAAVNGVVAIIRDSNEMVYATLARRIRGGFGPFLAEYLVVHEGLCFAAAAGLHVQEEETDAKNVAQALLSRNVFSVESPIVLDIATMLNSLGNVRLQFVPRQGNTAVHNLALHAFNSCIAESRWMGEVPDFLSGTVIEDISSPLNE